MAHSHVIHLEAIMISAIRKFMKEEDGITALEYGVLAALVAATVFAVFGNTAGGGLGTILTGLLKKVTDAVNPT